MLDKGIRRAVGSLPSAVPNLPWKRNECVSEVELLFCSEKNLWWCTWVPKTSLFAIHSPKFCVYYLLLWNGYLLLRSPESLWLKHQTSYFLWVRQQFGSRLTWCFWLQVSWGYNHDDSRGCSHQLSAAFTGSGLDELFPRWLTHPADRSWFLMGYFLVMWASP